MLWLSLYFSRLSLDVHMRANHTAASKIQPAVTYHTQNNQQQIYDCNPIAEQFGIKTGMSLTTALSIYNQLKIYSRDDALEKTALENLASWCEQFTPMVNIHENQTILLEVEPSLTLFGGISALRARMLHEINQLGYHLSIGIAPTPLAACILARSNHQTPVLNKIELASALRSMPITVLDRSQHILRSLRNMGVRTVGDCVRLPRDGLSQRFGPEFMTYLDKVFGRVPDPREKYRSPCQFTSRLVFADEIENVSAILFATQRLLLELNGFLRARNGGVETLCLELEHPSSPTTKIELNLATSNRNTQHLLNLIREHLHSLTLPSTVVSVCLKTLKWAPLIEQNQELFTVAKQSKQSDTQLFERLRARLGNESVQNVQEKADHRPEQAWCFSSSVNKTIQPFSKLRPVWLLEEPAALQLIQGAPCINGKLTFERGPERIESGWWDHAEVKRDYFIAHNEQHERFWIFRELSGAKHWFLHGIFS